MKVEVDVHLSPPTEDQHYGLLQGLGEPRQLVLILVLRIDMDAYLHLLQETSQILLEHLFLIKAHFSKVNRFMQLR